LTTSHHHEPTGRITSVPGKHKGATTMTATEKALRETFRTMAPDDAQQIRDAYYKAVEGLQALADILEIADAGMPGPTNELLIEEHLIACEALTTMRRSELGHVL
jgi:hypothetical protein